MKLLRLDIKCNLGSTTDIINLDYIVNAKINQLENGTHYCTIGFPKDTVKLIKFDRYINWIGFYVVSEAKNFGPKELTNYLTELVDSDGFLSTSDITFW